MPAVFDVVLAAARHDISLVFKVFLSGAEFPSQAGDVPANVKILRDVATAKDVYDCEVVVA